MTPSAGSSLLLRHLRLRHDDLGEETFAAQRKETLFNIAQHRFHLVSSTAGDDDENVKTRRARSLTLS